MKLIDLFEKVGDAVLYHAMGIEHFAKALETNELPGYSMQRYWPDGRRRRDDEPDYRGRSWMKGIRTTRDWEFARRWGHPVIIVLNYNILRHNHHIHPYRWNYQIANTTGIHPKKEREEFVQTGILGPVDTEPKRTVPFNVWYEEPSGSIRNLQQVMLGFYIDRIELERRPEIVNLARRLADNPKFLGWYTNPNYKDLYKSSGETVHPNRSGQLKEDDRGELVGNFWLNAQTGQIVRCEYGQNHGDTMLLNPQSFGIDPEVRKYIHTSEQKNFDWSEYSRLRKFVRTQGWTRCRTNRNGDAFVDADTIQYARSALRWIEHRQYVESAQIEWDDGQVQLYNPERVRAWRRSIVNETSPSIEFLIDHVFAGINA